MWTELAQEISRRGQGHQPFPMSNTILLDPNILGSAAFTSGGGLHVPAYRHGDAGHELRLAMIAVAKDRLLKHGYLTDTGIKPLFNTGVAWVALGRLAGPPNNHLDNALHAIIPTECEAKQNLRKAIWTGDHDAELAKLNQSTPSALDANPALMQQHLVNAFHPFEQLKLILMDQTQQLSDAVKDQEEEEKEAEEKAKAAEDESLVSEKSASSGINQKGDITDLLCKDGQGAAEKAKLADVLNKQAQEEREKELDALLLKAAVDILRRRLQVFTSFEAAKKWLTTSGMSAYFVRLVYADITQDARHQTKGAGTSKSLCTQPSKKDQEDLAKNLLMLPMTSVVGGHHPSPG